MKNKVSAILIMIVFHFGFTTQAQDIHFSHFYEHGILRNPALTGIYSGDYKVAVDYRNQWASIANPYRTYMLTMEAKSMINKEVNDYLSYGLALAADKAGSVGFSTLQIMPAFSYNKSIEDTRNSYLSVGFSGGYIQRSVDPSKMTFASQYMGGSFSQSNNSGEIIDRSDVHYWDLAAGVSWNSSLGAQNKTNYYIGVASYHITEPKLSFGTDNSFVNQSMKWSTQVGTSTQINQHFGFNLHANYSFQKPFQEMIVGGLLRYSNYDQYVAENNYSIYAGMFYRNKDAIIPTIKLSYMNWAITTSYDYNISSLRQVSNGRGGFELTLSMKGAFKKKQDMMQCPRFESDYLIDTDK